MDPQVRAPLREFQEGLVAAQEDLHSRGKALNDSRLGNFWKYLVGGYHTIFSFQEAVRYLLVVRIRSRGEVYR